jgi:putative zinc finger/helix-turn-helix YgiT family protein
MKNKLNCAHPTMVQETVELTGERNGESFSVSVPGMVCSKCGFSTISNKQSGKFTQAVSDAYRSAHGLLTGTDLKRLRTRLGMSQVEFAEHLGVGPASVKRWECGQIQDKAMDQLIRLRTDLNAALRNAHQLNASRQDVEMGVPAQVYNPRSKMGLDMSSLENSEILVDIDDPVAA